MARFKPKNRIRCTSTTTGTGAYTLGPASAGFQDFSALANGDRVPYVAQFGSNWEAGCGEKQGITLVRFDVYESTNGNAAVNWGAGTKFLFVDQLAEQKVVSPDSSIAINDNFTTGETELVGFDIADLNTWFAANYLSGVDIEQVVSGSGNNTQSTIHVARKIQDVADAGTIALDFAASLGSTKVVTVAGNRIITFANVRLGQQFSARLIYDATGGRVVTWPSTVKWVNGYTPAYTPVGNGSDTFEFERVASSGAVQYIGWINSTERPVILTGESVSDVSATLDIVDGVVSGPNERQWLSATIDSDYMDYSIIRTGTVSGGTFNLTIGLAPGDNQTISNIQFNATAFQILTQIWANTTLDEAEINVDGLVDGAGSLRTLPVDDSIHLEFIGRAKYAGYVISIDSTNLTGGGTYSAEAVQGGAGSDGWFIGPYVNLGGPMLAEFKFRFNGVSTGLIAHNANVAAIEAALGALPGIGIGNIKVVRSIHGSYYFEFINGLSGTDIAFEIQFDPAFLPFVGPGPSRATGQRYSTARNGAGPVGSDETNTITVFGSPTQGSLLYTVLGQAITIPVTATASQIQALLDTALGAGNSLVTGGPFPNITIVVTFIGDNAGTNIANSTLDDSGAGAEDIDWSICEGKVITLSPGNGTYRLKHVRPIPGKTLFVTLTSNAATGNVAWTDVDIGVPVNWGTVGVPAIPANTQSIYLEFYAETINDIHGKLWFSGSGSGGVTLEEVDDHLATAFIPGYSVEIDYDDAANQFTFNNYLTTQTLTDAATIIIDLDPDLGADKVVTIAGNRTFDITNEVVGKEFSLQIFQGGSGNLSTTFAFDIEWAEGFQPVQTTVVGKSDLWHFLCLEVASAYTLAKCRAWVETTERPQPIIATAVPGAANEVQQIHVSPVPTSGTWQITFQGSQTAAIPYNANATTIRLAVQSMLSVGIGNVLVSGGRLGVVPIRLEFVNALGGINLPQVTVQTENLQF